MRAGDIVDLELELLLQAIHSRYQYDFRHYARSSLKRRLARALSRFGADSLSQLQARLLREPAFFAELIAYLTVPTTELFRDPDYFRTLREQVVPYLRTYPSLKVWIAGCSTGEELYSMAILLREEGLLAKTILYATDINPHSLQAAKRGIYRAEAMRRASEQYFLAGGKASLSDYYSAAYDAVRFDPTLIEQAVISDHSLATDAVFAEVHLVSCRNVLIYFDRELQDRAFGLFDEALVRQGFLGLGSKETIHFSSRKHAFEPVCSNARVYRKR